KLRVDLPLRGLGRGFLRLRPARHRCPSRLAVPGRTRPADTFVRAGPGDLAPTVVRPETQPASGACERPGAAAPRYCDRPPEARSPGAFTRPARQNPHPGTSGPRYYDHSPATRCTGAFTRPARQDPNPGTSGPRYSDRSPEIRRT